MAWPVHEPGINIRSARYCFNYMREITHGESMLTPLFLVKLVTSYTNFHS